MSDSSATGIKALVATVSACLYFAYNYAHARFISKEEFDRADVKRTVKQSVMVASAVFLAMFVSDHVSPVLFAEVRPGVVVSDPDF
jgi:hypothetical protein